MDFKAKKKFGQNFLKNHLFVKKIVKALDLKPSEVLIEIGPGAGVLTKEFLQTNANVVAVEKDRDLIPVLREKFGSYKNFHLVNSDIRDFNPLDSGFYFLDSDFKVCGNLPFYLSGKILELVLEEWIKKPEFVVFMLQKEVCQKLLAKPGQMTVLSVINQLLAEFKLLFYVPKQNFSPKPKVDAGVVSIIPKKINVFEKNPGLKEFIKIGFSHPRKFLLKNLLQETGFAKHDLEAVFLKLKIKPNSRPGELAKENWPELFRFLSKKHL